MLWKDKLAPDILKTRHNNGFIKNYKSNKQQNIKRRININEPRNGSAKKPYIDFSKNILESYRIINADGAVTKIANDIVNFSSVPINTILFLIYAF